MSHSLTDTDHRDRFRVGRCGRHARSDETRARQSRKQTENWADPDKRRQQSEVTKTRMAAPSVRAKIAARTAEAMAREDVKQRQREGLARAWTPERRAAQRALTLERMEAWRAAKIEEARKVLAQLPKAERDAALASLAPSSKPEAAP
ncbi:MAG TPA: hypothetical protein VNR39_12460 [Pseudolabrys sp.]|nr:hypothetical protein [Pseudolabrys sp.]